MEDEISDLEDPEPNTNDDDEEIQNEAQNTDSEYSAQDQKSFIDFVLFLKRTGKFNIPVTIIDIDGPVSNTVIIAGDKNTVTTSSTSTLSQPSPSDSSDNIELKTEDDVLAWLSELDRNKDHFSLSFIFAIAILFDSPINFLLSASFKLAASLKLLYEQLPGDDRNETQRKNIEPTRPKDYLLQKANAKENKCDFHSAIGSKTYTSVMFEDGKVDILVKKALIEDFGLFQPILRTWLRNVMLADEQTLLNMGAIDVRAVRTQAAMGLGLLAQSDSSQPIDIIIKQWAKARGAKFYFVRSILAGYLSDDFDTSLASTIKLIKHWGTIDNYDLRWTAIAVMPIVVLFVKPEENDYLIDILCVVQKNIISPDHRS